MSISKETSHAPVKWRDPNSFTRNTPTLLFAALVVLGIALLPFPGAFRALMVEETGVIENATVLLCVIGVVISWRLFKARDTGDMPALRWWFLCFSIGLALLAGEEISWGQHWFNWQSPEAFQKANIQRETNFHNMAKWSEKVPKVLLTVAVYGAGLLWPLALKLRPGLGNRLPEWLSRIWPSPYLWPSAAIALAIRLAERTPVALGTYSSDMSIYMKPLKEGNELFLVLFVVLYLYDIRNRDRKRTSSGGTGRQRHRAGT